MLRYVIRCLLLSVPILLGITALTYVIINAAPGDPVSMMMDPSVEVALSDADVAEIKKSLGLDKPLPVRYVLWLKELGEGNLGYSVRTGEPVLNRIQRRLGPTLQLMGAALMMSFVLGIPMGVVSAVRQYSWLDYATAVTAFSFVSVPSFFMGLGMISLFSLKLNLLPTAGMETLGASFSLTDRLRHLVMPGVVLGLGFTADIMRYTRASMLEVLGQDYVRTARAKGLGEAHVVFQHALPNGLIPVVTVIGLNVSSRLLAGAVITEAIFQWPGMGLLSIEAIHQRDYPVLMGINLTAAVIVLLGNLCTDVAYAVIDPRIRYAD